MVEGLVRARVLRNFIGDEDGSAAVESVIWFPAFIFLFILIADVALVFHGQSQLLRVVQDANRNMSVGRFSATTETESYIENTMQNGGVTVDATTTVNSGVITTTVTVPASELDAIGTFAAISGTTLTVVAQHYREF